MSFNRVRIPMQPTVIQVLKENPKQVVWYYQGKTVLGFFMGQCIKKYITNQKQLSFSFMYADLPEQFLKLIKKTLDEDFQQK